MNDNYKHDWQQLGQEAVTNLLESALQKSQVKWFGTMGKMMVKPGQTTKPRQRDKPAWGLCFLILIYNTAWHCCQNTSDEHCFCDPSPLTSSRICSSASKNSAWSVRGRRTTCAGNGPDLITTTAKVTIRACACNQRLGSGTHNHCQTFSSCYCRIFWWWGKKEKKREWEREREGRRKGKKERGGMVARGQIETSTGIWGRGGERVQR